MNRTSISQCLGTCILALAILLSVTGALRAQDQEHRSCVKNPHRVFVEGGTFYWDVGELSDRIESADYERFSSDASMAGFVWYTVRHRRLVLGLEANAANEIASNPTSLEARLATYKWLGQLGFLPFHHPRLTVFPFVSLGFGQTTFEVRDVRDIPFDNGIQSPYGAMEVNRIGGIVGLGIHGDYLLPIDWNQRRVSGLAIGLRIQYVLDYFAAMSACRDRNVTDMPEIDASGLYLNIVFGWGGQGRE